MKSEHADVLSASSRRFGMHMCSSTGRFRDAHSFHVVNDLIITTFEKVMEKVQRIRCILSGAPRRTDEALGCATQRFKLRFDGMTMRPVRPEPEERPRIKRAMRAARIMKWGALPVAGIALLAAFIVGRTSQWYFGVAVLAFLAPFFILGYSAARCPHCGQVWWGEGTRRVRYGGVEYPPAEDETESMVCRRCHLDIGLGLREP
jgi:hypothetical protein